MVKGSDARDGPPGLSDHGSWAGHCTPVSQFLFLETGRYLLEVQARKHLGQEVLDEV